MSAAAAPVVVATDVVEVVQLDLDGPLADRVPEVLDADERARAARLGPRGARWAAARAGLRHLLGARLAIAPDLVRFTTAPGGKPRLHEVHGSTLRFNLAHSGSYALVALRDGLEVGVDLEAVRADVAFEDVARAQFSTPELTSFLAADPASRPAAFFRAWVRHEALAKAAGVGLTGTLPASERERWTVRELPAPPSYVAAVAAAGTDWVVRSRPA